MVIYTIGCCLFGITIGSVISACLTTLFVNSKWELNATEPMFLKHRGKFYKVIDRSVPKSWELANVRLKKQSRREE